jgi:hypothetical protein
MFIKGSCHYPLDISVDRIVKNINKLPELIKYPNMVAVGQIDPRYFIQDNTYSILTEVSDLMILLFCAAPHSTKNNIHIDLEEKTENPFWPALNVVVNGSGIMNWYKPTTDPKLKYYNLGDVFGMEWTDNYGEIIDTWDAGKVCIVKTDVPHNAFNENFGDFRTCLSIRWKSRHTWEETIAWYDENIKYFS